MVNEAALLSAFEHYSRMLLSTFDVAHVLHQLMAQAVEVLGVDGAGVCLADQDDHLVFVAATDADVAVIEEEQVSENEGPCHDAYLVGNRVVVEDLDAHEGWPSYRRVALSRGVRAVAGLPMPVRERRIGAMNLYWSAPHAWTDHELDVAQVLADMASGYIVNRDELSSSQELAAQLQRALHSRTVIEQAKGVLVGRHRVTTDEAFTRLRGHARSTSSQLHTVCLDVVDGRLDLPRPAS